MSCRPCISPVLYSWKNHRRSDFNINSPFPETHNSMGVPNTHALDRHFPVLFPFYKGFNIFPGDAEKILTSDLQHGKKKPYSGSTA
jgi:hypothetical protein